MFGRKAKQIVELKCKLFNEKKARREAEDRATDFARTIKAIEDIMLNKGTIVSKHDKINELLFHKKQ